jgi:hypothetical protein
MTSGGTDEIEIEIEIEIFRLGAMERQYGTRTVSFRATQARTRVWIEMFASSVGIPTGGCGISYFALVIIPYNVL